MKEKIIKITLHRNQQIQVEVLNTTLPKQVFSSLDEFLVWFIKFYSRHKKVKLLVFRGPGPYTRLRNLLTVVNLLSEIYQIPLAGFTQGEEKPKFELKSIFPIYA